MGSRVRVSSGPPTKASRNKISWGFSRLSKYDKHIHCKIATVNKNLNLIAAHLGIDKKLTNHVARHTFASLADHENIDIRDIQRMLNHSKLEQTIQYIHRVRKSDMLNEQAQKVLGKLEEE